LTVQVASSHTWCEQGGEGGLEDGAWASSVAKSRERRLTAAGLPRRRSRSSAAESHHHVTTVTWWQIYEIKLWGDLPLDCGLKSGRVQTYGPGRYQRLQSGRSVMWPD